jgi:hypothetical protein
MALYLVVHHDRNEAARRESRWTNYWDPRSGCLTSITTEPGVATRCEQAKAARERVYVYRCAYAGQPAVIACSVMVGRVEHVEGEMYLVEFIEATRMNAKPPFVARRRQNMEEAAPPLTES